MKTTLKLISIVLLLLFISSPLFAQDASLIPVKKLRKDLKRLVSSIEAHPKPYRHITEKEHQALIHNIRKQIDHPMSSMDFFKLVSPIYTSIKDGHTSLRPPMFWLKNHRKAHGVFPYEVYLSDENRLYAIENFGTDQTIPLGAEILALNGVSIDDFVKEVSPYLSYEQEIFRNTIIQNAFDFYLYLHFGAISEIQVTYLGMQEGKHSIKYIDYKNWKNELKNAEDDKAKRVKMNKPYDYEKLKEGVGIIHIYSFAVGEYDKYKLFLRNTFRKIAADKIESLIIDVRDNTGGFPKVSSDLFHYISEEYFKTMAMTEMKVSKTYRKHFMERYNANLYQIHFRKNLHYVDLESIMQKDIGTMIKEVDFFNEEPRTEKNEFNGDLYLLTDNRSFSASSSFAATFRCYQMGLIIGQETGGTKVFHANSISSKLDHSNLICVMATTRDYTACFYEEDEGIVPDIEVKQSVPGLVAKRDAVIDYTLHLIKKVKQLKAAEAKKKKP